METIALIIISISLLAAIILGVLYALFKIEQSTYWKAACCIIAFCGLFLPLICDFPVKPEFANVSFVLEFALWILGCFISFFVVSIITLLMSGFGMVNDL